MTSWTGWVSIGLCECALSLAVLGRTSDYQKETSVWLHPARAPWQAECGWEFEFTHSSQNLDFTTTDYFLHKGWRDCVFSGWVSWCGDIHMLPGRQMQLKVVSPFWMQVPPFWHGEGLHGMYAVSQCCPVYSEGHRQWYEPTSFTQTPPLRHGEGVCAHSLTSCLQVWPWKAGGQVQI